ncbi:MAG: hypothetical protein OEY33_04955 [Bdellovibrionales bacterium]|nr:hypothetical protein [Bdellovibrionales bacterium]
MKMLSKLCIVFLLPLSLLANEPRKFEVINTEYPILKISDDKELEIQGLLKRNYFQAKGPTACPLKLSGKIDNVLKMSVKMEALKNACLSKGTTLNSDTNINDALSLAENVGLGNEASVGMDSFGTIMGGLGVLAKRSCIKGEGTLEAFISVFTTMLNFSGMIPGTNGLAISGVSGGLLSTLMLIQGQLEKAWNFDDTAQRQNFIKLSCSFFDLRQELNASGLLNIPTPAFRADCGLNEDMIEYLQDLKQDNKDQLVSIERELKKELDLYYKNDLKSGYYLESEINELLPKLKESIMNQSPATAKLQIINEVAMRITELKTSLEGYNSEEHETLGFFNQILINELIKFDYIGNPDGFNELYNMDPEIFDSKIRSNLHFHFERILNDINNEKVTSRKKWEIEMASEGSTLEEQIEKRNKDTRAYIIYLEKRTRVLEKISKSCKASLDLDAELFGRSALIDIMANFNCLKSEIAAKTAYKFVDFSTKASYVGFKRFETQFKSIDRYLKLNPTTGEYEVSSDLSSLNNFQKMNLCQKGVDARSSWIEATGNIDQTVGYVKSISDLLVLPKVTLYRNKPEEERKDFLMTKGEKLRRHLHSINLAERIIKGEKVDRERNKKVLAKSYAGNLLLEKEMSRKKMNGVQGLMSKISCDNIGLSFGGDASIDIGGVDVDLGSVTDELNEEISFESDPELSEDMNVGISL